ncbi:MAG: hypothetical protein IKM04_03605 [Clostridia bacterium]|nr:hypothetical protein [Clostridia bacterium]
MIHHDTVRLLRECDSGVRMGVTSLSKVTEHTGSPRLAALLDESRKEHCRLGAEIERGLADFHDNGREPMPMAVAMSKAKIALMLAVKPNDRTVAGLMTDGCNMGVKSLCRYINQYKAADERSKDIAKKLVAMEAKLSEQLRDFL